jgi:hypothetical protein
LSPPLAKKKKEKEKREKEHIKKIYTEPGLHMLARKTIFSDHGG